MKKILGIILLFLLSFSYTFGADDTLLAVPTEISQNGNTSNLWYIARIKSGKTVNQNKVYGPFENLDKALATWIYNQIDEDSKYCIAKNLTYVTSKPSVYFRKQYERIYKEFVNNELESIKDYGIDTENTINKKVAKKESPDNASNETSKHDSVNNSSNEGAVEESDSNTLTETKTTDKAAKKNKNKSTETSEEKNTVTENTVTKNQEESEKNNKKAGKKNKKVKNQEEKPLETETSEITPVVETKEQPENLVESEPQSQEVLQDNLENEITQSESETPVESKLEAEANTEEKSELLELESNKTADEKQPENSETVKDELKTIETEVKETIPQKTPEISEEIKPYTLDFDQDNKVSRYRKEYLQDYMPTNENILNTTSDENVSARKLIENPDEQDAIGRTQLMIAAKSGNDWQIQNLLESKADVNIQDNDGWTALMYAVRYQESTSIIKKLLDAKADVRIINKFDSSALVLAACYNNNPEILKLILNYYSISEKEVIKAFIMMLSTKQISEYIEIAKISTFIERSIPLNSLYNGKTPLMYSAQYGSSTKVLGLLLENNALPGIRSSEGKTAFDYAEKNKNLIHDDIYWALNKK